MSDTSKTSAPQKVGREPFVKLFRFKENSDKAICLINEGYSFGYIGVLLNCDRTSVMDFYRRKRKEGVVFKYTGKKRPNEPNPKEPTKVVSSVKEPAPKVYEVDGEKVNIGMSYQDYVNLDNKKNKAIRQANLQKAQKLIKSLREKRKREGIVSKLYNYN